MSTDRVQKDSKRPSRPVSWRGHRVYLEGETATGPWIPATEPPEEEGFYLVMADYPYQAFEPESWWAAYYGGDWRPVNDGLADGYVITHYAIVNEP